MRQYCFVVIAVIACASASTVQDSNNFMDLVLEQHMPHLVMGNHGLYPGARIPDFNFKILKTRITNRDLKANITDGLIHGFDNGVHRLGNCEQPILLNGNTTVNCVLNMTGIGATLTATILKTGITNRDLKVNITEAGIHGFDEGVHRLGNCENPILVDGNTTVNCVLNMTGIGATLTATTKGDTLVGTIKTIWVNVTLKKETVLKVAVTALSPKPPSLQTFFMEKLKLSTKYDKHLSLNEDREDEFEDLIEEKVKDFLIAAVYNPYKTLFDRAVQMAHQAFPRA